MERRISCGTADRYKVWCLSLYVILSGMSDANGEKNLLRNGRQV